LKEIEIFNFPELKEGWTQILKDAFDSQGSKWQPNKQNRVANRGGAAQRLETGQP